jgi:hypothetical protein
MDNRLPAPKLLAADARLHRAAVPRTLLADLYKTEQRLTMTAVG